MVYLTTRLNKQTHQMSLEELMFGTSTPVPTGFNVQGTSTRTVCVNSIPEKYLEKLNRQLLIRTLYDFNRKYKDLREKPRKELYREFHIPKKSGGLRKIDAPEPELMDALRELKDIFEKEFGVLYHTSAFAYVKGRCAVDAVKKHQANESRWFGKFDLSNFFGSTTLEFVMKMFSQVFPFSEIVKLEMGREALETALELAFLDGGLPQGTPISPLITNVMMIPVDYKLTKTLSDYEKQKYIYTRYADDFIISSKYDFDFKKIESLIKSTLAEFDAPFTIKSQKTRYGSANGSNWNLGVMLNKDGKITVGHKKKRQFKAMVTSYVLDRKNGMEWERTDVQVLDGYRNYYKSVEGNCIDDIVKKIGDKFGVDVFALLKADLRK